MTHSVGPPSTGTKPRPHLVQKRGEAGTMDVSGEAVELLGVDEENEPVCWSVRGGG